MFYVLCFMFPVPFPSHCTWTRVASFGSNNMDKKDCWIQVTFNICLRNFMSPCHYWRHRSLKNNFFLYSLIFKPFWISIDFSSFNIMFYMFLPRQYFLRSASLSCGLLPFCLDFDRKYKGKGRKNRKNHFSPLKIIFKPPI